MIRIKKLDKFIAKQFLTLFAGAFFICLFVLMMQFLWKYVDDLIGKGLSMDVLAQFFGYMGLLLVPQALPLALLLSSLITFGNLGESSELTAIKAAGISLVQAFRSLFFITILVALGSLFFQEVIGPKANKQFGQLLMAMRQKSPELEIPEGIFYDGIPHCNIYVHKKDLDTGMLYGIMIYRMTNSYDDAAIILADSGMLQSTEEKKHLVLTLHSGEWFENMRSGEMGNNANIPYRRETFVRKKIVLDFDSDLNLADAGSFAGSAKTKDLGTIRRDIDSLSQYYDSIGRQYFTDVQKRLYSLPQTKTTNNSSILQLKKDFKAGKLFESLTDEQKKEAVNRAKENVNNAVTEFEFKALMTEDGDKMIRQHKIEAINKFTLALSCIIFFFIGAPLGAIIRKGGLGIPVIISVIVFIIYYIFDNTGYRMARGGMWTIWFGKGLAPAVLIPIAAFFTYKANNDSVVFNIDVYRNLWMKFLGLRTKRHIFAKEVIIQDPDYATDYAALQSINREITTYAQKHNLLAAPNPISVFFKYEPDNEMEAISETLDKTIEDLSNTRNKFILRDLNTYPILSVKAHTRPFERRWLNILSAVIVPLGLFFYFRMWRFRLRLMRDLKTIKESNTNICHHIEQMGTEPKDALFRSEK